MALPKNFGFGEDEVALKNVAQRFFKEEFPSNRLHNLVASQYEPDREPACNWNQTLWKQIVDLGWLSTAVPERVGGLGMSAVAITALLEQAGKAAFPSPLLPTLSSCYLLAACNTSSADKALEYVLEGKSFSLAFNNEDGSWENTDTDVTCTNNRLNGKSYFVQDAKKVDYFIVKTKNETGIGLYLVPAHADGLTIVSDSIVDLTRDQATLHFNNVVLEKNSELAINAEALQALIKALPAMLVFICADMCGAAEWQLQTTAEYAKVRVQFDRPIGFFQAVKHPLSEFMVEIDQARSHLYQAACAIDHEPEMATLYARMAKSVANDTVAFGSRKSIQLHGGIGFTWECFVHIYMKRQLHNMNLFGDAYYQRQKLAELLLAA